MKEEGNVEMKELADYGRRCLHVPIGLAENMIFKLWILHTPRSQSSIY